MKNCINYTVFKREGKEWIASMVVTDEKAVYKRLAEDIIAKKLHNCAYIRRIDFTNLYNGLYVITAWYFNDIKVIYTIKQF